MRADLNTIRVIGHDPGNTNYGFAVVDFTLKNGMLFPTIVKCGELEFTVKNLGKIKTKNEIDMFLNNAVLDVKEYQPHLYIAERFMTRGIKGKLIEHVNLMLGLYASAILRTKVQNRASDIELVNPGTWKKAAKKFFDLDMAYKVCPTPIHEFDAILIAMYRAYKYFGLKPFSDVDKLMIIQLFDNIKAVSTSEPIKRRRKINDISL